MEKSGEEKAEGGGRQSPETKKPVDGFYDIIRYVMMSLAVADLGTENLNFAGLFFVCGSPGGVSE